MSFNKILALAVVTIQLIVSGNGEDPFTDLCEFDLVDELAAEGHDILDLLPKGCEAIESHVRQSMKDESVQFQEFMDILGTKEKWDDQGQDVERVTLDLDYDLRKRVYNSTIGNCTETAIDTQDYVNCRMEYRKDLILAINETE